MNDHVVIVSQAFKEHTPSFTKENSQPQSLFWYLGK